MAFQNVMVILIKPKIKVVSSQITFCYALREVKVYCELIVHVGTMLMISCVTT